MSACFALPFPLVLSLIQKFAPQLLILMALQKEILLLVYEPVFRPVLHQSAFYAARRFSR